MYEVREILICLFYFLYLTASNLLFHFFCLLGQHLQIAVHSVQQFSFDFDLFH